MKEIQNLLIWAAQHVDKERKVCVEVAAGHRRSGMSSGRVYRIYEFLIPPELQGWGWTEP